MFSFLYVPNAFNCFFIYNCQTEFFILILFISLCCFFVWFIKQMLSIFIHIQIAYVNTVVICST